MTVPVFAEEESETTAAVTESIETTDSAESADSAESSDEADEPDAAEEAADAEDTEDAAADPDSEKPETFESGEYSYSLHKNANDEEDGTIVLETYWGTEPVLELPSELDGKTVSALGESFMTESHSLTEVTLPATVTELGAFTFASCQGLTDYHVAEGNPVFESRDGVLYAGDGTLLMRYPAGRQPTEMEVPERNGDRQCGVCRLYAAEIGQAAGIACVYWRCGVHGMQQPDGVHGSVRRDGDRSVHIQQLHRAENGKPAGDHYADRQCSICGNGARFIRVPRELRVGRTAGVCGNEHQRDHDPEHGRIAELCGIRLHCQ